MGTNSAGAKVGSPSVVPTIITEFGYNTDVSSTGTVTTGSASGSSGINISSNWTVGVGYNRRVIFSSANLAEDVFTVEHDAATGGATWVEVGTLFPYIRQGTNEYGVSLSAGSAGSNYVDVSFAGGGFNANGATYAVNGSAWTTQSPKRWRVRRDRFTSTAYGAGLATAIKPGLADPYGTTGVLASGTYTPIFTNTTNISASSPYLSSWMRVGKMVFVCGGGAVATTAAGNAYTELGISLPIASDLTLSTDLSGVGSRDAASGTAQIPAQLSANTGSDRAYFVFNSNVTTNLSITYSFMYILK